ncbi:MAG TPA: c-type cytochrome [Candidatus Angelobacter sp.]
MRTRFLVLVLASALGICSGALVPQQESAASTGPRTVWKGVYTSEQAKRGESLYRLKCAQCHGDKLTGGDSASPLTGGQFLSNWNGLTLDVLFERIRTTMPSDNPARVGRPAKADILAYILSVNRFPSGKAELQYKTELLKGILIEANKP